ncbi:hypothetical protein BJ742DRAFT_132042 [Cladochytrium replicatum]|nr:hypothetical protein BJ742DRAFT_132042 [Cladochytrium replicatum]
MIGPFINPRAAKRLIIIELEGVWLTMPKAKYVREISVKQEPGYPWITRPPARLSSSPAIGYGGKLSAAPSYADVLSEKGPMFREVLRVHTAPVTSLHAWSAPSGESEQGVATHISDWTFVPPHHPLHTAEQHPHPSFARSPSVASSDTSYYTTSAAPSSADSDSKRSVKADIQKRIRMRVHQKEKLRELKDEVEKVKALTESLDSDVSTLQPEVEMSARSAIRSNLHQRLQMRMSARGTLSSSDDPIPMQEDTPSLEDPERTPAQVNTPQQGVTVLEWASPAHGLWPAAELSRPDSEPREPTFFSSSSSISSSSMFITTGLPTLLMHLGLSESNPSPYPSPARALDGSEPYEYHSFYSLTDLAGPRNHFPAYACQQSSQYYFTASPGSYPIALMSPVSAGAVGADQREIERLTHDTCTPSSSIYAGSHTIGTPAEDSHMKEEEKSSMVHSPADTHPRLEKNRRGLDGSGKRMDRWPSEGVPPATATAAGDENTMNVWQEDNKQLSH